MRNLTELNKLEEYLKINSIPYERIDKEDKPLDDDHPYALVEFEHHQIVVYENGKRVWDAICHRGSYGAEEGLLEIYGEIVPPEVDDSVEGGLTAENVIERMWRKGMINMDIFNMTNTEAALIIGNMPVYPDECYDGAAYQWAKGKAIDSLMRFEWIPCTERTPNAYRGYYLITTDKNEVDIGWWSGSSWESFSNSEVIAWMILPEPYKEK